MVLSYKSQLWQHNESINCNKLLYNKIPAALKYNSLHKRLTINHQEKHSQGFPSFCPTVSPLALENLNKYTQLTIYHSIYLHPVLQKTCWQEDSVILVNWNTFFSVEACTDLMVLFMSVFWNQYKECIRGVEREYCFIFSPLYWVRISVEHRGRMFQKLVSKEKRKLLS